MSKATGSSRASRFKTSSAPLTRDEIIVAALRYAEAGDLAGLTVRGLAHDLDVTPMALYRHIRDKDDILEAVTDRLLAAAGLPDASTSWSDCLLELAISLRKVLRAHPPIVALYTRRPVTSPVSVERLVKARDSLMAAGHTSDEADRIYAAVHTYTLGFCALEGGRHAAGASRPDGEHELSRDQQAINEFVTEDQFTFGLRALVGGLA